MLKRSAFDLFNQVSETATTGNCIFNEKRYSDKSSKCFGRLCSGTLRHGSSETILPQTTFSLFLCCYGNFKSIASNSASAIFIFDAQKHCKIRLEDGLHLILRSQNGFLFLNKFTWSFMLSGEWFIHLFRFEVVTIFNLPVLLAFVYTEYLFHLSFFWPFIICFT